MTEHRKPLLPAEATEVADARGGGALGAPRHRIAMTMLGSTVAACAVVGSMLSAGPVALAADAQHSVSVAKALDAVVPAESPVLASAGTPIAFTGSARTFTAVRPVLPPKPVAMVPAAVVTPPPVVHAAVAKTAPAKKHVVTHTSAPVQSNPYSGESAYKIAEGIVPSSQFGCFDWIVSRESGWNVTARNPSSGAYGLGQALPGDKMASAGPDWETNPVTQIDWTLSYMDERYGSPCAAQGFWESHGWY
jgi:hypothetical protein